jgi:DNA-binding response OmpR family regulator
VSAQIEHDLRQAGLLVTTADTQEDVLELLPMVGRAAIILDSDMAGPKWDAFLACIRERRPNAPILAICGADSLEDEILALTRGADDVLTPRMDSDEVVVRILRVATRRAGFAKPVLGLGGLHIDTFTQSVSWNGRPVPLTPSQYHILEMLALRGGGFVANEELLDLLYGADSAPEPQAIRVFASHLRKRLREAGAAEIVIECVSHLGFRLLGEGSVSAVRPDVPDMEVQLQRIA